MLKVKGCRLKLPCAQSNPTTEIAFRPSVARMTQPGWIAAITAQYIKWACKLRWSLNNKTIKGYAERLNGFWTVLPGWFYFSPSK